MRDKIIQSVYSSISQINETVTQENPLPKEPTTILFGSGSELDSLGLINLIVAVEEKISENFNISITLADDRALSKDVSPFTSVQTLIDYIGELIEESANA